jgi:hypothetical protein
MKDFEKVVIQDVKKVTDDVLSLLIRLNKETKSPLHQESVTIALSMILKTFCDDLIEKSKAITGKQNSMAVEVAAVLDNFARTLCYRLERSIEREKEREGGKKR